MGTTCNRILFVASAIIFYSNLSFGQATAVPAKPAGASAPGSPVVGQIASTSFSVNGADLTRKLEGSAGKGCENRSKTPIENFTFVGFHFAGEAECVNASNDRDAKVACAKLSPSYTAVNPANPQYGTSIMEARDGNSWGYYLCIKKTPTLQEFADRNDVSVAELERAGLTSAMLNDKASLCRNIAPSLSPWRTVAGAPLDFRFSTSGNTDGDCQCRLPPDGPWQNCDRTPPASALVATQVPVTPVEPSAPLPVDTSGVTARLNSCIERYTTASEQCKEEAQKAVDACDERNPDNVGNRNSGIRTAAGVTEIMGQVYNMQNRASGAQAECFRAGAAANTASTAIRGMQEQCSRDSGRCQALCRGANGKTKEEEFREVCAREIGKTAEALGAEQTPDAAAFNAGAEAIREKSTEGLNLCTGEVKKKSDTLSNLLSGVGRALQASVQCACETSSGGTNCRNIPSVQDCTAIPQPAGCGTYESMATCSVGSGSYNAKTCSCMQNPAAPGCGGGSNAVSSFSGPPIAGNIARGADGGVSFGSGGGGGRASGLSLGGGTTETDSDLSFLGGAKPSGSGGSNASVGGGGAPAGGGAPNGDSAAKEGSMPLDEEKGLAGIFSAAKTFMSNALGGKKPASKDSSNGALAKPDMGKFKPLRGLAGKTSGMGSRNMDIWKMMNACSSGDTCKSNEGNFLTTP